MFMIPIASLWSAAFVLTISFTAFPFLGFLFHHDSVIMLLCVNVIPVTVHDVPYCWGFDDSRGVFPDVIMVSSTLVVAEVLKVTPTRFSMSPNLFEFLIFDNVVYVESMGPTAVGSVDETFGIGVKFLEIFKVDDWVDLEVGG